MSLKKKITLGLTIFGGVLFTSGAAMFGVGGAGSQSFPTKYEPYNFKNFYPSGYFYLSANFGLISDSWNQDDAKKEDLPWSFMGYAQSQLNFLKEQNDKPVNGDPIWLKLATKQQLENYFNAVLTDYPIFIAGAVLWPIGFIISAVTGVLFFVFKKRENI